MSVVKLLVPVLGAVWCVTSCASSPEASIGSGDYVLATTIFDPEGANSLVRFVDDPTAALTLDTGVGIEVPGAASLFGEDGEHTFALGGSDAPTLTRYDVGADGALVASSEPMSLATYGITSGFKRPGLVPFVSRNKAYFLDDRSSQAIVFDPETMTISTSISLAAAERPDLILEFGERAVVRDEIVFVPARYRNADDGEAGLAAVLVIDTNTDTLLHVATDTRCGDTVHAIEGAGDALYFGTGTVGALFHARRFPAGYPEPCVLRIEKGQTTFDPDYHVSLAGRVGGRDAGRLIAGPNGHVFVLALHPELLETPIDESTPLWDPWEASAWRFWRISLDESAGVGTLVESAPASSAGGWSIHAGSYDYIARIRYDEGRTTLYSPREDGTLVAGLDVGGVPYGLVRVR